DRWRVDRKNALDTLAIRDLADGEILVEAAARAGDADAFIGLDAGARTLGHLDIDAKRVARREFRDGAPAGNGVSLLLLDFLADVHGARPSLPRQQPRQPSRRSWPVAR